MKLLFEDNFTTNGAPDPTKWDYDKGGHGWGNNESQHYTDAIDNAFIRDGRLFIVARKEPDGRYTSARLVTRGKFSVRYGRIETEAKLPRGKGSWPAIWMLPDAIATGTSWPLCGEIDIMEHVGKDENRIVSSLHSQTYNHVLGTQRSCDAQLTDVCERFHRYACEWDSEAIAFFYDGTCVGRYEKNLPGSDSTVTGWPFDQPFHLLLNIAVGGNWGGPIDETMLPFIMEVAYVRVYQ